MLLNYKNTPPIQPKDNIPFSSSKITSVSTKEKEEYDDDTDADGGI